MCPNRPIQARAQNHALVGKNNLLNRRGVLRKRHEAESTAAVPELDLSVFSSRDDVLGVGGVGHGVH